MLFSWDNKQNPSLENPKPLNLIEKIESKSLIPPTNKGLLIKGNNLDVMVSLLDEYKGKIDLIYIDPPYLTGLDFKTKDGTFAYTDKFTKDGYIQFVYERLYLMRELLSDTGSIYVHVDYRTSHYIRLILDDLFGEDNFRNEIIWRNSSVKNDLVKKEFGILTLYSIILKHQTTPIISYIFLLMKSISKQIIDMMIKMVGGYILLLLYTQILTLGVTLMLNLLNLKV